MEPVTCSVGGTPLYGEYHAPGVRKAKGAVLMLHGFNSCVREHGDLPERLAEGGFHVLAFDQRGFGASGGERGRTDLGRLLEDVEAAVAVLRQRAPKARLGILGHSLGGTYALAVLGRRGGFDAAVIAHPIDRLWDEVSKVERPLFHLIGRVARRRQAHGRPAPSAPYKVRYRDLYVDRSLARKARDEAPYLLRKVNTANYDFARTMSGARWASRVTAPVLAIHSPHDKVVPEAHSMQVVEALGGEVEHLEHRGGHSCFRDVDAATLAKGCIDFFSTRLGGKG